MIRHLFTRCKYFLTTFNIFPSVPPSTDQYELHTQRISTKLFFVIFIISSVILLVYNSLIIIRKTNKVETPSLADYIDLNSTYSQTLACSCSDISINYGKFIQIKYTLHQVCSSIFVSQPWFEYLANTLQNELNSSDFRVTGKFAFQALRSFCELINVTILDNQMQFYSNQYVSTLLIPHQLLNSQIKSLTDKFRSSMTNSFLLSLAIIRDITQANAFLSVPLADFYVLKPNDNSAGTAYGLKFNDNCTCLTSRKCINPFSLSHRNSTSLFHVPDFYVGCYVIEALLQSSLKCFYNQSCIEKLQSYIFSTEPMTVIPLDASAKTNYSVNSTIEKIINNLMIEEWSVSTIYETYYNECQPIQCTYQTQARHDIIYIVATLFGVASGLITALKLIVPRIVKFVRKQREQQQSDTGKRELKTAKYTALKLELSEEVSGFLKCYCFFG